MIVFRCAGCNQQLQVPEEWAGKMVRCAGCNQPAQVPAARLALEGEEGFSPAMPSHGFTLQCDSNPEKKEINPGPPPGNSPGQELHDFLAPPQEPGELGRLGRYRVVRVLGHGGMGVVFQAEDTALCRLVALKVMLPVVAASATHRRRFLREAQAAAAIQHDHIVTIHELGEDRGIPFLAMPLLQGETLADRLKRPLCLTLAEAVRIGRETAEGLAAAHVRGLIHRDVKPANIWLEGARRRVKILDFGLARSTDNQAPLTRTGNILGTPAYMAPEQATGARVDHRCDLFSLGCLLYQMCTGELPFKGGNDVGLVVAVTTQEPRPIEELNPEVPQELSGLVRRLLAKRCQERPGSAQEVADALAAIEGGLTHPPGPGLAPIRSAFPVRLPAPLPPTVAQPSAQAPAMPIGRARPGRARNPALWWLLGVGALLLVAWCVWVTLHMLSLKPGIRDRESGGNASDKGEEKKADKRPADEKDGNGKKGDEKGDEKDADGPKKKADKRPADEKDGNGKKGDEKDADGPKKREKHDE
jgi:hypothetical protein